MEVFTSLDFRMNLILNTMTFYKFYFFFNQLTPKNKNIHIIQAFNLQGLQFTRFLKLLSFILSYKYYLCTDFVSIYVHANI
jgi:hypothetical protein